MTPLTLHLHGTPRVVAADGRETVLERRAAALCALAVLEGGVARERAAAWLWPDSPDPRRNLRQQLLRFRQQFGAPLLDGDARLVLAAGVRRADETGPLLQGLAFDDTAELAEWVESQRRAADARHTQARQAAIAAAEAAGDLDAALAAAEALAAADPASEAAERECLRLHFLRGEAAAGLVRFERLRERLAGAYGTTPAPATLALAESLRRIGRDTAPAVRTTAGLPVTLRRPPLLAGREHEHAAVQRAWAEGCVALVEGEAGLGKSRLLAEFTGSAGTLAAAGRPGDAGAPYATLARLLGPLLRAPAAGLEPAARQALDCLDPMAPAGTAPLRPGALAAAVDALLQVHRIDTVALDDLHFADAATLELVAGLAAAPEPPRRWLLAQRPAEAPPAAQALHDALAELRRLVRVPLAPLAESAAAALVDALGIPGLAGAALAPALVRHTGGNPLYLLETLKQGLQDGSLARGELPRPAGVGALIERRLQRLGEPALALARVAAIAGIDFRLELAEAALGQTAVQLASAWQELQDAQVLRDEAFAHDLVADAARRSVPPVIARRVHGQCAAWLHAHGGEPARVAEHWWQAGEPVRAGDAFRAAALRAERSARLEEQAALYTRAVQAYEAAGDLGARFDAACLRLRVLTFVSMGDAALAEAQALEALAVDEAQWLRARRERVGLLAECSRSQEAVDLGTEAMAVAERRGDRVLQVQLACHMASALCRLGRAGEALSLLRPLRAWVQEQPDPLMVMLWHGDWAATLGLAGRLQDAVAAYDTAIAAARRADLPDSEARLLLNCAVTLRQSGRLDRALATGRRGRALSAEDTQDVTHQLIAALVVARDEAETAHYDSALAALEAIEPRFVAVGTPFWIQACRMVLAQLWLHLGQPARAMPLLRQDLDDVADWLRADRRLLQHELALMLHQHPGPAGPAEALALVAADSARAPAMQVRALRGLPPDEVLARATPLQAQLRAQDRGGALMALLVHVAQAALARGDAPAAAGAADALLALFDDGCAPDAMYRGEAWLAAHRAFAAAGRAADAARALDDGLRWVRGHALPHVPAAFVDSFLHRNPANAALLAAAR